VFFVPNLITFNCDVCVLCTALGLASQAHSLNNHNSLDLESKISQEVFTSNMRACFFSFCYEFVFFFLKFSPFCDRRT
jgi:hypothetical protein